jgi:hypothetical protein
VLIVLLGLIAMVSPSPGDKPVADRCAAVGAGTLVPTEFVAGRIFAVWHLTNQRDLRLYTDTGGGAIQLYLDAVRRIGAVIDTVHGTRGRELLIAKVPRIDGARAFPPMPIRDSASNEFLVVPGEAAPDEAPGFSWDGRLGAAWFAGGVWTFDYPDEALFYNGAAAAGPTDPSCWVPLGFQVDSATHQVNIYPRIAATVAGDTIQFLVDTGARTVLTDHALAVIGDGQSRYRATSFIQADRFDAWHAAHPDWLVVEHAEAGSDSAAMIRVPEIDVGGLRIGPVWFTERPNMAFRDILSQSTDRPVDGALGGSAWKDVVVIVDYPRKRAALLSATH